MSKHSVWIRKTNYLLSQLNEVANKTAEDEGEKAAASTDEDRPKNDVKG